LKKPLLTKPVNETKKRGIIELFDEYKDYDLYIIFLYRNPVNVYFSQLMKRIKDQNNLFGYNEFMDRWNLRNKHVIEALSYYKDKIFLVRYEDLIANKRVFFDLCNFVDIDGDYIFEKDSNKGVNNLHEEVIHELKRGTSKIINLLDSNRTYKNNTRILNL